jgi:biotin carboxyl carrier protein
MKPPGVEFSLTLDGTVYRIVADGNTFLVNGQPFVVGFEGDRIVVDGVTYDVALQGDKAIVAGIAHELKVAGLGEERATAKTAKAAVAGEGAVTAIMPGKIIRVLVAEGDAVEEGDVVCILEAMKMENELKAPRSGQVKVLHVQAGQDVETGAVLAQIE